MYRRKENITIDISTTRLLQYENTIPYIGLFYIICIAEHLIIVFSCKHVAFYYTLFYYHQAVHKKLGSWFMHAHRTTSLRL